jgi:S1-C subfamily serine protease
LKKEDRIGVNLQSLTPEMASYLGLGRSAKGAVITEVEPGSRGEKAGLRPEDVIIEIDRKPVEGAEEAAQALRAGGKTAHLLKIRRGNASLFITVAAP